MFYKTKNFAFTIIDDTDNSTLDNAPIIYNYLKSKNIITTKSIWVKNGKNDLIYNNVNGDTIENLDYLNWVKDIQNQGFEICLHSTSWSASKRNDIVNGFEIFEKHFGRSKVLIQHNDIKDNESIYWGSKRLPFPLNLIFEIISFFNSKGVRSKIYQGEVENSEFFWGDVCKQKVDYIRNLVFPEINLFNITKYIVHKRKSTKYVNNWFISSEAPEINSFVKLLSKENIDKLERENGICIIYTHFGNDFVKNGILDQNFKDCIDYLATKNGWFVPASHILDYIKENKFNNIVPEISYYENLKISFKWLFWKIFNGTS